MKKTGIFGLVIVGGIVAYTMSQVAVFNSDIRSLFSGGQAVASEISPHAAYKPEEVDYGMLAMVGTPEVLGEATGFTLNTPSIQCINLKPRAYVAWVAHAEAPSYVVQRKAGKRPWKNISGTLPKETLTYTDSTIGSTGIYSYRIRTTINGAAVFSNAVSIELLPCQVAVTPQPTVTPIPTIVPSATPTQVVSIPTTTPTLASTPTSTPSSTPTTVSPTPSSTQGGSVPTATPTSISTPKPTVTPTPTATATPKPTPTPTKAPTPTPTVSVASSGVTWGIFNGWRPEDGPAFENIVGKKIQNRAVFSHWGNENDFPSDVGATLASGATLTIFWEAMDYNGPLTDQPRFNYDAINRGDWDAYIKSYAADAKAYGRPVILIPFEEMNGNWNPWAGTKNGNSAAKHITAYRRIHDLFAVAPNVKMGWAVNAASVPSVAGNQIEDYYPGDAYVDIVGVDGFNFNDPWMTFSQIFDPPLKKLALYKKPVYIFSTASAAGPLKAGWITDAFSVQLPKHPEVKGWIWFNENKEQDWRVWSDAASLAAFKAVLP